MNITANRFRAARWTPIPKTICIPDAFFTKIFESIDSKRQEKANIAHKATPVDIRYIQLKAWIKTLLLRLSCLRTRPIRLFTNPN